MLCTKSNLFSRSSFSEDHLDFDSGVHAYKHWLYHSLLSVQVEPAAQTVGPVHPLPPHCPHFGAVPPFPPDAEVVAARVVVVAALVVVTTLVVVTALEVVVGVVTLVVVAGRAVVVGGVTTPPSGLTTFCHGKVELIGPHLISEKTTYEFGELASTSAGTPESRLQVPRLTPGSDGSLSRGN